MSASGNFTQDCTQITQKLHLIYVNYNFWYLWKQKCKNAEGQWLLCKRSVKYMIWDYLVSNWNSCLILYVFFYLIFILFIQITELLYKDERFSKGGLKPAGKESTLHTGVTNKSGHLYQTVSLYAHHVCLCSGEQVKENVCITYHYFKHADCRLCVTQFQL